MRGGREGRWREGRREGRKEGGSEGEEGGVEGSLIGLDWLQHESLIFLGMIKSVIRMH